LRVCCQRERYHLNRAVKLPMIPIRAILGFVFTGGLLVCLSPFLIHEASVKHLPWSVPMIVIPIYAALSYGAYKRLLRRFHPRAPSDAQRGNRPDRGDRPH
jgi:hypothetical protein